MVQLLRRWMVNSSRAFPMAISSQVSCMQQIRSVSMKRAIAKTTLVQLIKDVPKLGLRGDVVAVKSGRMRNTLLPYSMAQYIRPGNDSFLTQHKLAVPVGPSYRKLLKRRTVNPALMEFNELFSRARRRLIKAEKLRPSPVARDEVLLQIQDYYDEVQKSTKYNELERAELSRFLRSQLNSWGMLGDDLKSDIVRKTKEKILVETWQKYAAEMKIHPQGKPKQQKGKKSKKGVERGLEEEPSTSETLIQGDVQVLSGESEVAVSTHEPVGQTMSHHEELKQEAEQEAESDKSPSKAAQKV